MDDHVAVEVRQQAQGLALLKRPHDLERAAVVLLDQLLHRREELELEVEPAHGRRCSKSTHYVGVGGIVRLPQTIGGLKNSSARAVPLRPSQK